MLQKPWNRHWIVARSALLLGSLWLSDAAIAQDARPVSVGAGFLEERKPSGETKPAADISGISCRASGQGQFRCLIVNDESTFVQWGTLVGSTLTPDTDVSGFISLIGKTPPGRGLAFDDPTSAGSCSGGVNDKFNEFDGEAIAWTPGPENGGTYYVVGSHSCSRKESEAGVPPHNKQSTHLVARIQMLAAGPKVDVSWRLGPSLKANQTVGPHYNKPLREDADGLDIEGAAMIGGRLYLGLRAPSSIHAAVLSLQPQDLFVQAPTPGAPVPIAAHSVSLGSHVGIRDLAALPDGRLLILGGAAQNQAIPFSLHVVRPSAATEWGTPLPLVTAIKPLVSTADPSNAKSEGLTVLSTEDQKVRVLVVFEKPNDGAVEYRLDLPQ